MIHLLYLVAQIFLTYKRRLNILHDTKRKFLSIINFPIIDDNLKTEMVSIFSIVVRNVRVDNVLMSKLLNLNARMSFGAFAIEDDMVIYKYNLLGGEHIDEDEFFNALLMVAIISDEYDNKIISTHGGITAVDFVIEHIRKEEGKSLSW